MKKNYKSLMEKTTPVRSNDEVLNNVLRKAERMNNKEKKHIRKPFIAAAAAAAALSIVTVSVGAVNNWSFDISEAFRSIFAAEKQITGLEIEVPDDFDFSKYGIEVGQRLTGDGFAFDILGIVSDYNSIGVVYRTEITDKNLEYLNGEQIYATEMYRFYDSDGNVIGNWSGAGFNYGGAIENSTAYNMNIMAFDFNGSDCKKFELSDISVDCTGFHVGADGHHIEPINLGKPVPVTCDVDFRNIKSRTADDVNKPVNLTAYDFGNNTLIEDDSFSATVRNIRVTPLKIEWEFDINFDELNINIMEAEYGWTSKDGVYHKLPYGGNGDKEKIYSFFQYPVDIDNVASVTLNNLTYPIA